MEKGFLNIGSANVTIITALLFLGSCKDPYYPSVHSSNIHYLVVEGFINPFGVTNIRLTRTRNISKGDTAQYINETGATVIIEDNQNNIYSLKENGGGNYSASYFLNVVNKYRIHIHTSDNKEYVSDFVPCKLSPPIDNLGWKLKDGDVQVFVNTHDPQNKTIYYRWEYVETWEYHALYHSELMYDEPSNSVVNRPYPVYVCYRSRNSSNIILGSSARLQQDIIHEGPLQLIPNHSRRISVLYSILVTQYALDSSGYNYWYAMKGNTENTGSIFGTQPNQTKGNIHNVTDSLEIVIGYISSGSTQQKRMFISNSSLPKDWNRPFNCFEIDVPADSLAYYFMGNAYIPYDISQKGYLSASNSCVDCRFDGGTLTKPVFWP